MGLDDRALDESESKEAVKKYVDRILAHGADADADGVAEKKKTKDVAAAAVDKENDVARNSGGFAKSRGAAKGLKEQPRRKLKPHEDDEQRKKEEKKKKFRKVMDSDDDDDDDDDDDEELSDEEDDASEDASDDDDDDDDEEEEGEEYRERTKKQKQKRGSNDAGKRKKATAKSKKSKSEKAPPPGTAPMAPAVVRLRDMCKRAGLTYVHVFARNKTDASREEALLAVLENNGLSRGSDAAAVVRNPGPAR